MKATYWQRSESLDYVNKTDKVIEANSIVDLKTRIACLLYTSDAADE